jgi:CheY-like chemotaxis protein
MAVQLNRKDRVKGEIEEPRRFGLGPFVGDHSYQRTRRYAEIGSSTTAHDSRARRILFVEDDRFIADMYRMRLEGDGWSVELAHDGEAGLARAVADPPALILLDLLLPRIDGLELLRRLRAAEPTRDVPVLIVSNASGLSGRESEARELGIVDWIVKANTTPAALAARVARILSQ